MWAFGSAFFSALTAGVAHRLSPKAVVETSKILSKLLLLYGLVNALRKSLMRKFLMFVSLQKLAA